MGEFTLDFLSNRSNEDIFHIPLILLRTYCCLYILYISLSLFFFSLSYVGKFPREEHHVICY